MELRECGPRPDANVVRVPMRMWSALQCECGPRPDANVVRAPEGQPDNSPALSVPGKARVSVQSRRDG